MDAGRPSFRCEPYGNRPGLQLAGRVPKTEAAMRAEWDRVYMAMPKTFQETPPISQDYVKKQTTSGTCIPHAELTR